MIELMIAVAVIGILSAIAYPAYQNHILRTHRAAAAACLQELALQMERRYTVNMAYNLPNTDLPVVPCVNAVATRYTLQFAPVAAAAIEPVKPARQLLEIKSPTPGTFYSSPKPTDPPFVQVGSKVGPGTIVCIIEAMKIFNEIPADLTGTIVEVCVESKQPVEYGQVLFRIDPAA